MSTGLHAVAPTVGNVRFGRFTACSSRLIENAKTEGAFMPCLGIESVTVSEVWPLFLNENTI